MRMSDVIEKIGTSVFQHGPLNNRIYLQEYGGESADIILGRFDELVREKGYTKIFLKVPSSSERNFTDRGFIREAVIPPHGEHDGKSFLAKYPSASRRSVPAEELSRISDVLKSSENTDAASRRVFPERSVIHVMTKHDAAEMAEIYRAVFDSYPFPIFEPEYLQKTMDENIIYFGLRKGTKLVGISSAEISMKDGSVEMTDFAVLPEFRGEKIAVFLLEAMEKKMADAGMKMFYTIARSVSYGMNKTFAASGYKFGGTLFNNTNISGRIESMNIWFKYSNS